MKTLTRHFLRILGTALSFCVLMLTPAALTAQAPTPVDIPDGKDAATMDLLGLRLHMGSREVIDVLNARFHLGLAGKLDLHFGINSKRSGPYQCMFLVQNSTLTPKETYLASLEVVLSLSSSVILGFSERYPFDPARPEELESIRYNPGLRTDADKADYENRVFEKYGLGVNGESPMDGFAIWCKQGYGDEREVTDKDNRLVKKMHYDCELHSQPTLTFNPGLTLEDQSMLARINTLRQRQLTTAPPL